MLSYRDVLARKGFPHPVGYHETPKYGGDLVIRRGQPTQRVPAHQRPRDCNGRFIARRYAGKVLA